MLDRGRAEDEGGRQGEARLPVRNRVRRSRPGPDPGRRRADVRGRAARDRKLAERVAKLSQLRLDRALVLRTHPDQELLTGGEALELRIRILVRDARLHE